MGVQIFICLWGTLYFLFFCFTYENSTPWDYFKISKTNSARQCMKKLLSDIPNITRSKQKKT